jgi:hypothetical protein
LFLAVLLLNGLVYLFLFGDHRMVRGEVTREFFESRLRVLQGGDGPAAGPGGLLLIALRPLGPWLGGLPPLTVFHASMFVDELVFLLGIWLLSLRFYGSPRTAFFVTVAAAGSVLWTDHVYGNFLAYQSVPLALWWIHEFLDRGSRCSLLAAALLLALQGTLQSTLIVLIYLPAAVLLGPEDLLAKARALRWQRRDAAWLGGLIAAAALALARGAAPKAVVRTPAGVLDLLIGLSLEPEVTVFCGFFTIGFAIHALTEKDRGRRALLALALGAFLILSLAGSPLPMVKLFVVFLSGAGLERALREKGGGIALPVRLLLLTLVLLVLALASLDSSEEVEHWLRPLLGVMPGRIEAGSSRDPRKLPELLGAAALACGTAAGACYLLVASPRTRPLAVALILLLHPADLYGWKSRMVWFRTTSLTPEQHAALRIPELPRDASVPGIPRTSPWWTAVSIPASAGSAVLLGLLALGIGREAGLRRRPEDPA